jgi:hypothetical protein
VKEKSLTLPGSATEDEFHISVAQLLDVCLSPPTFYTTFPAGYGRLSKATSGRLRAKGMKAGMPDILVFDTCNMIANRTYTKVIGLELKAGGNSLSSAQRGTHAKLQAVGVRVYIVRCLNDVTSALHDAGIKHRSVHIPKDKTEVEHWSFI